MPERLLTIPSFSQNTFLSVATDVAKKKKKEFVYLFPY